MAKDYSAYLAESGLTEEQFQASSEKAEDIRKRLEAGEELGIPLKPALANLKDFYRRMSCMKQT